MTQFITTRLDYYKVLLHGGTRCAADLFAQSLTWEEIVVLGGEP